MRLFWCLAVTCAVVSWMDNALAQRRPIADDTLGDERSIVTPEDNIRGRPGDRIEGGARRGDNLFHSFQEFNIDPNRAVYFDDPNVINILSRVTGGNVSDIQGTLGVLGDANLFLINPSGIIFGPGARLDVGGSFVSTTADAIQFGDQGFFSASDPNAPPLLTVQPSAFLFNQVNSGTIRNNSIAFAGQNPSGANVFGLRVPDGQSLLLVGGDIILDGEEFGGRLNAFGGRVELGGLSEPGTVLLNADGSLGFPVGVGRSDVSISNGIIDVTAGGGGSIAINARNIAILDRSRLQVGIDSELGFVDSQAGDITLNATETIEIVDSDVFSNVGSGAVGDAGDITIAADTLFLRDGATIINSTSGAGNAGRIDIIVTDTLAVSGVDEAGGNSLIASSVRGDAEGDAGDIIIAADTLFLRDGVSISNTTSGAGNAGNIDITVTDTLIMSGLDGDGATSVILSSVGSEAEGDAGDITIAADTLFLRDGASIDNSTSGAGNAGRIDITVTDTLAMGGVDGAGVNSFILSSVGSEAEGDAGDITIAADTLFLRDGASINNSTYGTGDAGRIDITVKDTLAVSGVDEAGGNSLIESSVRGDAEGDGGDITIAADTLFLRDGASIDNSTSGAGNAGRIDITVTDTLIMSGVDGDGVGSSIESSVGREAEGDGGDITIAADTLFLRDGVSISNGTDGTGDAGRIDITVTDTLAMSGVDGVGGGFILSSVGRVGREAEGDGGDITIAADTLFLRDGAFISNGTSGTGNAGRIDITVTDTLAMSGVDGVGRNSFIESSVGREAEGNAGDITIAADTLFLRDGASISNGTSGAGNAGRIDITVTDTLAMSGVARDGLGSFILSSVGREAEGDAGDITIAAGSLFLRDGASIINSTSGIGNAGRIDITVTDTLTMSGVDGDGVNSFILSSVRGEAEGNGGNITITADSLFLRDGASINNSTYGRGDAGRIDITVKDTLAMSGVNGDGVNSFIASAVDGEAEGDGGNITIAADSLFLRDGALLSVTSFGQGQAGNIDVQARDINLDNGSRISAETEVTGRGGNITLQGMNLLVLRNGSSISTTARTAQSGGDGGNITTNADFIVAVPNEDSDIRANAREGNGGRVDITTEGLFGIEARDQPTSLSDITASSELGVQGTININTPDVDPSRGLAELPADVVDASNQIAQTCPTDGDIAGEVGEFVVTGRGGVPADPAELLGGETVLTELAEVGDGGEGMMRGEIDRPSTTIPPQAELVEAQGWVVGADGKVVLTAENPAVEPHGLPIAPVSCPSS